jgi:t-SNARE complex subunit (syntaxin)
MRNLLPKDPAKAFTDLADSAIGDEEQGQAPERKQPDFMDSFFKEIERAKAAIHRVRGATATIKSLQDEAVNAIGSEPEQVVSGKLATVLIQANKDCALAKRVLENLKKETESMDRKKQQADIRVRENIHATVLQTLVAGVRAYQTAQQEYKSALKDKATRQVRVVKPDATYHEVETAMQSGDVNAVYREAILQPGSDPVAHAYLNVSDKLQDVLKLERSVEELHKMFMDLAVLVTEQGEMLNSIEHQVFTAKDYMEQGNLELEKALKARKAVRRRMCCLMIVLVIVMAVILGPVLGVFK